MPVATFRETHPSPVWDQLEPLQSLLERFQLDVEPLGFLRLMGDTDLSTIRAVADNVWGTDVNLLADERDITVTGALSHAHAGLDREVTVLEGSWNAAAYDAFAEQSRQLTGLFKHAALLGKDVGDGLRDFAEACDAAVSDTVGSLAGWIPEGATVVAAVVAAATAAEAAAILAEFAVAVVFAYAIYLGVKSLGATVKLDELNSTAPPLP